jgi:hypothetical protein
LVSDFAFVIDPSRALEVLGRTVRREAFVLSFRGAFTLPGVVLLARIPLVWTVKARNSGSHGG